MKIPSVAKRLTTLTGNRPFQLHAPIPGQCAPVSSEAENGDRGRNRVSILTPFLVWRAASPGIFLVSFVLSATAQQLPLSDLTVARGADAALAEVATDSGPGVAVLIARGENVIYRDARGQANIELGVPLTPDHVFRIASITKIFTASLVIKLAEAGELALDDPLNRFLPDFPGASTITIRQLLSHTAGVSDQTPAGAVQPGFSRRDVDTAILVGEISRRQPSFSPGTDQSYSNAGYVVLGAVVEKVTGKPWHMALEEHILIPLGLEKTTYGAAATVLPGRVAGYTTNSDGQVANASFISMTIPASAGALVSTPDDLLSWIRALVDGRVLSSANFRDMITPATVPGRESGEPYGLGIYVWRVRGETMIGHTGQINGFASIAAYVPSRDVTIVALGNSDSFDAQNFGRRLAAIALGNPYTLLEQVPISTADLTAIAGRYRDGAEVRTLLARDGKLYSQRAGRNPLLLQMTANGELHFLPDELSYFVAVRDASGTVVRLDYFFRGDGPPRPLPRIRE